MIKLHTEKEAMALTGYSRASLLAFRKGGKQTKNGKIYKSAPFLVEGKHYHVFGRTVMYTDAGIEAIRKHRALSQSQKTVRKQR